MKATRTPSFALAIAFVAVFAIAANSNAPARPAIEGRLWEVQLAEPWPAASGYWRCIAQAPR